MEEKSIDILEYLLKIKVEMKKEPSKIERDKFCSAWVNLALSEGYSEQVERYLFNGASYCGAKPFKIFLDQVENKKETVISFFTGKLFGQNADTTFRLLVHLFTLLLNDKKSETLATILIMPFSKACIKKDKKRLSTAETIMLKYFFAELDPNVNLPSLTEIGDKESNHVAAFVDTIAITLKNIDSNGLSKSKIHNINKVQQWIEEYVRFEKEAERNSSMKPIMKNEPTEESDKANQNLETVMEFPKPMLKTPDLETAPFDELTDSIENLLKKLGKATSAIQKENIQQKIVIDALSSFLESEQEKSKYSNQQIIDQQHIISELSIKLAEEERQIMTLKQTLEQREAKIVEKDIEIAERIQMAEVLNRDRNKQTEEALQRIASKVNVEYRDFQDAMDIPMSCDLGENLRLQLQSIFSILEKGGIKIK